MKVRINQSIKMEDVPNRIYDLLEVLREECDALSDISSDAVQTSRLDSKSATKYKLISETLAELKVMLMEVGRSLEDVSAIIGGYINLLEKEDETPNIIDDSDIEGPDMPEYNHPEAQ